MRDLHSTIKTAQHLEAKAYTVTQDPTAVDIQGFDSLDFLISVGAITNANESPNTGWKFKLQESDSSGSGFTDVTDSNSVCVGSAKSPTTTPNASTGTFLEVDGPSEDQQIYRIGYRGAKRYVKCVPTAVNTPGSTPLSIVSVLGHPSQVPTAD